MVLAGKETVIDDGTLKRALSDRLLDGLSVKRIGRTYALELTYNSTSPVLAAQIVNAVASAYLVDKLNSKYEATKRASDWLSDRIAELRQRALDTDLAVQKFRAEHGLIETGNNGLLSDQQLAESNSALILAQSETASHELGYNASNISLPQTMSTPSSPTFSRARLQTICARNISNPRRSKRKSPAGSAATMFRRCVCATKCRNTAG